MNSYKISQNSDEHYPEIFEDDRGFKINTRDGISYRVDMVDCVFSLNNPILARYCDGRQICAFMSSTIDKLYGAELRSYLATWLKSGSWSVTIIPTGEYNKTLASVELVCEQAKRAELGRHGIMLAVGGGIVCDIVGFAASFYCRGIDYIKLNTTLLGQVDVSVGIKTGVNAFAAKNLLGSFHRPLASINDLSFLRTLPSREIRCGLSEIVKVAVIADEQFFVMLEKNPGLFHIDDEEDDNSPTLDWRNDSQVALWRGVIRKAMRLALECLCPDLKELETARNMDFGHTFGPAIEMASGHRVAHGESVAIDMALSSEIARLLGFIDAAGCERILALIASLGLPLFDAETCTTAIMQRALVASSERRSHLNLVVPSGVGSVAFIREIEDLPLAVLAEALAAFSARPEAIAPPVMGGVAAL